MVISERQNIPYPPVPTLDSTGQGRSTLPTVSEIPLEKQCCRIVFTMNRFQQIKNPQTKGGGIHRGQ